MTRWNT